MIKVDIFASNQVDGAFILVYAQPRHLPECLKNDLDGVDVLFFLGLRRLQYHQHTWMFSTLPQQEAAV
jgi:hypothetical protein